jgi:hypothetical protein
MGSSPEQVALTPEQAPEVAAEVAAALELGPREPDPWWRAGLEEQFQE